MYPSHPLHPHDKYGMSNIPVPVSAEIRSSPYTSAAMYAAQTRGSVTPWSTGLCHCLDDPGNCLITCICPCITSGQIADIVDEGTCSCVASATVYGLLCLAGLPCLFSCFYRSKLRGQYDLEEGPVPDCLIHCCCEPCALCQEHRELKNRGFDMGIGWKANMERQRRGVMMAPPVMGTPAMGGMLR